LQSTIAGNLLIENTISASYINDFLPLEHLVDWFALAWVANISESDIKKTRRCYQHQPGRLRKTTS
jgi:hypothetical protein